MWGHPFPVRTATTDTCGASAMVIVSSTQAAVVGKRFLHFFQLSLGAPVGDPGNLQA